MANLKKKRKRMRKMNCTPINYCILKYHKDDDFVAPKCKGPIGNF